VTGLTVVTAVACGLVGGVFFAFSTFVMRGLRDAPDEVGLAAMQSINRAAPTPLFMLALMGTAVACVVLGVWSLLDLDRDGAGLRVAGSALYLVTLVVTGVYHVPRNNALATATDPIAWTAYAGPWVSWNHVRTFASLGAAALLTISLT
jgi:uncharacterized membrane protein